MTFIAELRRLVDELAAHSEVDVPVEDLRTSLRRLDSDALTGVLVRATQLINSVERVRIVSAGVAAERSARESGYLGTAQTRGHRTPVALIQSITGVSRAEAAKQVRLGESLLGARRMSDDGEQTDAVAPSPTETELPWHEPLGAALMAGGLTSAQHDAILRGLGEPPAPGENGIVTIDGIVREIGEVREVWRIAAEQLLLAACEFSPEELLREARRTRDLIDPEGAAERSTRRHENRQFRMWVDESGQSRAQFVFDDDGAAWVRAMIDAGLRPRRGGPRFVGDDERVAVQSLVDDPRTNDQLAYDLVVATLKAGSLATPEKVFGARQPGVRVIVERSSLGRRDPFGRLIAVGRLEDRGDIVSGPILDRALCTTGFREVHVDEAGNPLRLGREQRLFSAVQKLVLAVRDGGCIFPECTMPASYCEAHHIDHYGRDQGRTDVDRGVLLCAFHHLLVHNAGWEITRDGLGSFLLHPPPGRGGPITLHPKTPLVLRLTG